MLKASRTWHETLHGGPSRVLRDQAIMEAADLENWPINVRLTLAPIIDRTLLAHPKSISTESRSHHVVLLDKTPRGTLDLDWRSLADPNGPFSNELPDDMRPGPRASLSATLPQCLPERIAR